MATTEDARVCRENLERLRSRLQEAQDRYERSLLNELIAHERAKLDRLRVAKAGGGLSVRIGEQLTLPFRRQHAAICEANRMVADIRRQDGQSQAVPEDVAAIERPEHALPSDNLT